ncbi:MAG: bifunctional DNA-formamidopyrimidine glycosylase/DNA-(apurinic or apyrimidinic site) lyase [Pseudomonadota bacterium]
MPELPEVETTRRGIAPHVVGKRIDALVIRQRQLRWPIPKAANAMRGETVDSIERRGKYLLMHTASGCALLHLGMSGSLRIVNDKEAPRKHDHVDFVLNGETILRFHDPRRFGAFLWTEDDPFEHALLANLGPEPLGDDFGGDYLFAHSRKRKAPVKNFIMDSRIVVGVGNIYASESLFLAGVRPAIAAGRVSRASYGELAMHIREVLGNAIAQGGTTLRDFVNPQGSPGYFAQSLFVYGRAGEPCRVCKTPIKSRVIGQRNSFYCPSCQ